MAPTIAATYLLVLLRGRQEAIRRIGPRITAAAKASLRYWVPDIQDTSQFDLFRKKLRSNIGRWKPLYDVTVIEDTADRLQVHVANCPFCEVFPLVGLGELNGYFCRADWDIAGENRGKWTFERTRTIANGDGYCDHTYKRCSTPDRH